MGAVQVEFDQDLVDLLEELHRPVKPAARELIVLKLYRQGEASSGRRKSCSAWSAASSSATRQLEAFRTCRSVGKSYAEKLRTARPSERYSRTVMSRSVFGLPGGTIARTHEYQGRIQGRRLRAAGERREGGARQIYTAFSDEELGAIRETVGWLKTAEKSFDFWNNPGDAVYDTL